MKNTFAPFLLLLFIAFTNTATAQKDREVAPEMPIDKETKLISYTEVVQLEGTPTKDELYERAKEWFARYYKSSNNVLQIDEKENGKLVGKAALRVYIRSMGADYEGGIVSYTISVYVKEGRYKYEITDFVHNGQQRTKEGMEIKGRGPAEVFLSPDSKLQGKLFGYYLNQIDAASKDAITSLKEAMAKGKKSNNW